MTVGRYPSTRLRRNRHDGFTRRLVAENNLSVDDLIWPIFVTDGHDTETEVSSMPGVKRVTLDRLAAHVAPAARLGIPAIALFPMTPLELRDDEGTESGNPDNLICRSARLLKAEFPEIGLIGDVALDPYTSHGHDGVLRETPSHPHYVANDASVARAGPPGAEPGAERHRHPRTFGHDGWPHRRHPNGAGYRGPGAHPADVVRG